jgi:hypothetical protein
MKIPSHDEDRREIILDSPDAAVLPTTAQFLIDQTDFDAAHCLRLLSNARCIANEADAVRGLHILGLAVKDLRRTVQ